MVDFDILSEHNLRFRLDLASNLLISILDFCSGERSDSGEASAFEELVGGEEESVVVFKRLEERWKKSVRVLEELDIFWCNNVVVGVSSGL